jgi:hypothetical protein
VQKVFLVILQPQLTHGRILEDGGIGPHPESVFKELILCEIRISNFFNEDHFITKSNYTLL